jgi:large subunit ribosomal protein L25
MPVLKVTKRDERGSRQVRRLRGQGLIPAVIYGHKQEPQAVSLSQHEVDLAVLHGERLLEVDFDGKTQNALIKDVQYDVYGKKILHVDLTWVDLDERVEVTVPIVLKGTPIGVSESGGVLQQTAAEVTIECFVRSIPEEITVLVGGMKVGDHLTMADLPLADGATLVDDAETSIATVRVVTEVEEAVAEEPSAAEPEVIGEKKEEEGEGEATA